MPDCSSKHFNFFILKRELGYKEFKIFIRPMVSIRFFLQEKKTHLNTMDKIISWEISPRIHQLVCDFYVVYAYHYHCTLLMSFTPAMPEEVLYVNMSRCECCMRKSLALVANLKLKRTFKYDLLNGKK